MSFTAARTSRISAGAVTPVRTLARTALSHPVTRASHAGSAPTGVWMTGWSAMSSGIMASRSATGCARSKPKAASRGRGRSGTRPRSRARVLLAAEEDLAGLLSEHDHEDRFGLAEAVR